jgi:HTH-type transcriptional regulator/antitoxin HigA
MQRKSEMNVKPIKNKKDYEEALKKVEKLFDAKANTADGDLLEVLVTLIEAYEHKHFHIPPPDPIEAIKFRMEQLGLKQSDIAEVIGGKNRASEILNKKRELTAKMMRDLHRKFNIPAESLLA